MTRLVHYSSKLVRAVDEVAQSTCPDMKPQGLWVSADDHDQNWRDWCIAAEFGLDRLTHVHDVTLAPDANVLHLRGAHDILAFNSEYCDASKGSFSYFSICWQAVAERYDGIIIAPYVWSMRLDRRAAFYYGWDCASGCIWHPRAVASIVLRELVPVPVSARA